MFIKNDGSLMRQDITWKVLKELGMKSAAVLLFAGLYWWLLPENRKLAYLHSVPVHQVYINAKPHDCDFDRAPYGNKECHFEKLVQVEQDDHHRATAVIVDWVKVGD